MNVRTSPLLVAALAATLVACGSPASAPGAAGTAQPAATNPATAASPTVSPVPDLPPTNTPARAISTPTQPAPTPTPPATVTPQPGAAASPVDAAVQTVLDYFDAINRHDYSRAYHYWAREGAATQQTLVEFTAGYSDTVQVTTQISGVTAEGTGAALAVTVPATTTSVVNLSDGSQAVRLYQENFTLRPQSSSSGAMEISSAIAQEVSGDSLPGADVADPTAILRSYFDAINSHDYARAYTYWSTLGQASGQSFAQFEQGFATTARVRFDLGVPQEQGAAGSMYSSVPVVVQSTETDGTTKTFCGSYRTRKINVPPFPELGWRMDAAEVGPSASVQPGSAQEKSMLTSGCQAP